LDFITEILLGKHSKSYKKIYDIEQIAVMIRLKNGFSFINSLPKVSEKKAIINGLEFEQGDILVRPMYNKFKYFHLKHYGFYYGTDEYGLHYIVNKEPDGYIYVRELSDYMKEIDNIEIEIIKKPENTSIDDIISRARSMENEPYTALDNNCQHFINYAVFNSRNSISVEQMKQSFLDKVKNFKESRKNKEL
jgi:predicted RNA-binding protein with RPS1 domain